MLIDFSKYRGAIRLKSIGGQSWPPIWKGKDMLIRNQKKNLLLLIENSIVIDIDSENSVCMEFPNETYVIGKYSSKEKAMKVLDMIEREYVYCERCRTRGEEANCIPAYAFQMPQDNEVQV